MTPQAKCRLFLKTAGALCTLLLFSACTSSATPPGPGNGTNPPAVRGSGTGTTPSPATSSIPGASGGVVVDPGQVPAIVANDTAVNNRANGTLSTQLQDEHEACLQALMDDYNYQGVRAAGQTSSSPPFQQVPHQVYMPAQSSYPAHFSVLASFVSHGSPNTDNLLTYVKASAQSPWKLTLTAEIFGPTDFGVTVPGPAPAGGGFSATPTGALAPSGLASRIAAALTTDATTGRLPAGVTAQWGPRQIAAPRTLVKNYSQAGVAATVTLSATPPPVANAVASTADCPSPDYRLATGGTLAVFPLYLTLHVTAHPGVTLVQGAQRSQFGVGLAPGSYLSVTTVSGDVIAAVIPPTGSPAPIEVIGQGLEQLSASGASTSSILTSLWRSGAPPVPK